MEQEDLILLEEAPEEKVELEIVPDFSKAIPDTSRRLKPSTTSYTEPNLFPHLEIVPIPGAERSETDDELFRRIESDVKTYKPTDDELDKYLDYKARQPKYALDLIKGVWHGGKAVVGDLAGGVWGAVKDPELLFSPTPEGMLKRGFTLAEGAARATWDLGTVGRYINDWFGEQGDREYREEIEDMKLRQSNPDWKMRGAMGAEGYLSKEQKEEMRKSWATSYIKARIKEDLQHLEETTNNFKDPDLKRDFDRSGLKFVDGETRDFYTSSEYINNVLSTEQRDKYYEEFPKWINKRRRDRWRRGRYLMRTTELARAGEQTVLGEIFGPKVDEAAKAYVNSEVATLASYMGGPAEAGAVLSTKLARKSATSPSALAGKATEKVGKGTQWAGGKIKQFGEWATTSPEKSAAVGAALGVASGDDSISVLGGALGGLAEQRIKVVPTAGEMLQKAGTAVEAVGEVIAKPEGVEGLLKSASRVAKDEGVAKTLNYLSGLDPAINLASDLGKGAVVGGTFGGVLTLPSGDPEVIGSGLGAGGVGGFAAAAPGRYLTRGPRLKEQLQNEWSEFQKQLTPEQLKNIKEYAPTLDEMGNVITTLRMVNGVTRGGGNIDFKILSPTDFAKAHGVQRGVVVTKNKTRPSIEINAGYRGPNSLYHEAWHALKRFAGETEIQKTPDGKQEVAVLRPHLEQIQSILFGKKLEGKTVTEGLFKEKDLIGGFYDQYTSKMAPEERAAFQKQFELGEDGKKLTPAEADQKKLNYMMEEIEAESFRYLMSNTNPRQIAQGNRSLHQRFIDHMLLSEHSKTLRGMRKALETVGIDFKPSGQPSDIFMQKGQGITNSRELNAALRQYLRAWEGMQHRTRVMGDLEPSGFSIGGTGKAGRAQVEYHLSKKENDFLRDHFSSSDMLKKNKDGGVYYDPDGRVILLTEGEIKKLQENRSEQIREKLSETDDGTGMVMMENGSFEGIPSPHQLDAIDRISNEIITPNQKQIIRETAEIMRNDPGAPIQFLYNAALGKGKTYSSSLSSTHRTAVPLGFHISKAQNFYFTSLDLGAYHRKISAWGDPTKKALHKGGHKLALWDKDVRAFEADLFNYLDNHKHGRKGAEGLDPNAQKAEQKRNVLNDFFDINRNKEADGNFNPVTAARRAIDPKTGKQKKRAYRGLENLIRSYRLDRVLDENFGKSFSYALGKAIPMKSGAAFHEGQRKNLMPAPGEDMVAVHNLSADNLKHSLKMGGIASPSMAILDITKADFDSFGEITLVASKDLVDPKKGAKVFGSDAYSPRYPDITTEIPKGTRGKMQKYLDPVGDLIFYKDAKEKSKEKSSRNLFDGVEDKGWKRGSSNNIMLQAAYLIEKGRLPDVEAIRSAEQKANDIARKALGDDAPLQWDAVQKAIIDEVRKDFPDLEDWVDSLPEREGWEIEEKIFRGFTPMGNRRYQPHTLDNVVKIMKRNIRGGEGFNYGVGTVRSKVTPQFKSVAQIKKNRGKLTDPSSMEAVKNEASHQMGDLADAMEPHLKYKPNGYLDLGVFSVHLQEAAERGVRSLKDYYDEGAPFEKVTEFLGKLKDLPTGYFEAKIPRAVQLEEFSAAIIPSDLDPKLKKVLEERGLELREYDRKEVGKFNPKRLTRREALQKQTEEADLRFMPAPTFYSKAERAVEASQQKTMSVDQAVALATKDIPKAEYEWSGVVDWLEGRKEEGAAITKESKGILQILQKGKESKTRVLDFELDSPVRWAAAERMREKGFLTESNEPQKGLRNKIIDIDAATAFWEKALIRGEELAAGKISKDSLLKFLQNKGVKVEEVYRSGDTVGEVSVNTEITDSGDGHTWLNATATTWERNLGTVDRFYDIYIDEDAGNVSVQGNGGRFIEIDAPINNQTLKDAERAIEADVSKDIKNKVPEEAYGSTLFNPDEGDLVLPGGENYSELVLTLPEDRAKSSETFELPGSHRFPESNILAHIRFTERVDADGKKMLFIEEMQSDWSNEGRRDGWKKERPAEVKKKKHSLLDEKATLQKNFWGDTKYNEVRQSRLDTKEGKKFLKEVDRLDTRIAEIDEKYPFNPGGAPDMPFKGDNRYGALAMKRMIRWAADNGFDRLGWITGKDTAARYDLSKHVDVVKYYPQTKRLIANKGERGTPYHQRILDKSGITPEQLEAHLGKDVAKKLLDSPLKEPTSIPEGSVRSYEFKDHLVHTLAGDDLKVGGVWAETLYDKVLPTQAKKIVKKKGAVGRTRLGGGIEGKKRKQLDAQIQHVEVDLKRHKEAVASVAKKRADEERFRAAGYTSVLDSILKDTMELASSTEALLKKLKDKQKSLVGPEANYVDITPEVKALAQEGFSYFMPPGGGKGRGTAPAQPAASSLPATPIMPRVKLSDREKEDSRRLLNLLKEKGI